MKLLAIVGIIAFLATGAALAQPEEIQPEETISLKSGQEKLLVMHKDFRDIVVVTDGIVRVKAHTNRTISVTAVAPGATNMFFLDPGGKTVYSAMVVVGPADHADESPGHIVRMYGWSSSGNKAGNGGGQTVTINNGGNQNSSANSDLPPPDYIARYCSETGCGNPLIEGVRKEEDKK